ARRADCKALCGEKSRDRIGHSGTELDDDVRARRQQAPRVRRDPTISGKPIRAAIERELRIVVAHLRIEPRPFRLGNVRRVAENEIETAGERGAEIAGDERRAVRKSEPFGIFAREIKRRWPYVGPDAVGISKLMQQREQQGARTAAAAGDAQTPRRLWADDGERRLDQGLGLRPGHQHRGRDDEREAPELLAAENAGDRLAGDAPSREGPNPLGLLVADDSVGSRGEVCVVEPERVADEEARIELRRVESCFPERGRKRPARTRDGDNRTEIDPHAESSAASRAAWLSVTSASTISPSASPSITCGSLCSVRLMR